MGSADGGAGGATRAELVENLKQVAHKLGRTPANRELDDHGEYSRGPYRRVFGRWTNALQAAGLVEEGSEESQECPWDGCQYVSNEDGVKRHHKLAHGESVAGAEATCTNCGKTYRTKPHRANAERTFHSRECFEEWYAENPLANTGHQPWHDSDVLRKLYVEQNKTAREVGEVLGCSCQAILRSLDRFGIEKDEAMRDRAPPEVKDREALYELYAQQGLVAREIAEKLDCPTRTVSGWIKRHGFEPHWGCHRGKYDSIRFSIRDEPWEATTARIRERDAHTCQMCGDERAPDDRRLDVHHIPALLDGGCNADELLISLCNGCHRKAECYLQSIPEVEACVRDWSDDELPEGRERWTPDDASGLNGQTELSAFGDD